MKIETKYQEGLKKLIKEKKLDEINVIMLCNAVKSNRQTFYYHYRDISDVVESIFLKENIGQNNIAKDFESDLKTLIAYINANYSFISAINESFASDKLKTFFYSYFYSRFIERCKKELKDNHANRVIARYMATLFSSEIQIWVANKRREKPQTLLQRLKTIYNYFTKQYMLDLKVSID